MTELEVAKKKVFNLRNILITVGIVILLFISYVVGSASASTEIEDRKVDYNELVNKIKELEDKRDKVNNDIGKAEQQLENKKSEYDDAMAVINNKEEAQKSLDQINSDINGKKTEIETLDKDIETKKAELAAVTGQIIAKKEEPKVLSAGFFTVGKDIPASRYKVTPNRGSGNFFVNDGMKVNIILGRDDGFASSEYIFEAEEGDVIELTLSATFTPIQ